LLADVRFCVFFFFNDTATTEIYTLSLHDALPICVSPPIECERLPDGAWRAAEKSLPSGIAQHHGRHSVQVGRTKRAALRRGRPKYFEEARRDGFALRAARAAAPGDRILLPLPSGDPVERAALAVEDLHIAIAGETLGLPAGGLPDGRQARGIAKGQRAQQDSVHQAEDQRIGANPQGQQ